MCIHLKTFQLLLMYYDVIITQNMEIQSVKWCLRNSKICLEKLSSESSSADQFVNEFSGITKTYSKHQIFDCDETRLYFRMSPGYTLASVHNWPDGTKKSKDRMTINACENVSGTIKLPLLLIDNAKNPHCFCNFNCQLPTKIKQILGLIVKFSKIGFLTVLFQKQIKRLEELGQEEKAIFFPEQLLCTLK